MVLVGIEPHANTERQLVDRKIATGSGNSNPQVASFWSDRHKGFVLATLQARVNQVGSFVESCTEALTAALKAMYPLNAQPNRLSQLLKIFRSPEEMKWRVRHQLVGGAKVALAFVRVDNPNINFWDLHKLPSTATDRVELDPHYAEVGESAEGIIDCSNAETKKLLREPRNNP